VSSIRNINFYVLICVVSLTLPSSISLNIHNQCQDIKLTSPVYFIHGGKWHVTPDQEIDSGAIMKNRLEFDSRQNILEGTLLYKIQRQYAEYDEFVQNESKLCQLLVAWHIESTEGLHIRALLVEHDRKLDEDKLRRLHQRCWYSLNTLVNSARSNWLLDNTTVLGTTVKAMNGGYRWDVFISEEERDDIKIPLWIDTKR
jgi:hypothetical protein